MATRYTKGKNRQEGFTIVEFMIATAVFSMVILLCSYAIIHVGRMYHKGVLTNRTQDTARRVVDDMVAAIQFGQHSTDPRQFAQHSDEDDDLDIDGVVIRALCLGTVRYTYAPEAVLSTTSGEDGEIIRSRHVLWRDELTGNGNCAPLNITEAEPIGSNNGKELLGHNMRLPKFTVVPPEPGQSWHVSVRVVYGDEADLFEDGTEFGICKGAVAGGQFCAVSALTTNVTKRL